jgi:hypothetical protein
VGDGTRPWRDTCNVQLNKRFDKCRKLATELNASSKRQEQLTDVLNNPATPGWMHVRQELEREQQISEDLTRRSRSLAPQPFDRIGLGYAFAILVGLVLDWWIVKGARSNAKGAVRNPPKDIRKPEKRWAVVYGICGTALFSCHLLEQVFTSVVPEDKQYFEWESYCISHWRFLLMRVAMLGTSFAQAYMVAVFAGLFHPQYIPELDLSDSDRAWGLRQYIDFLKKWSFVVLAAAVLIFVPYLKCLVWIQTKDFNAWYLLTPLSYLGAAGWLIGRAIFTAYQVRRQYYEARRKNDDERATQTSDSRIPEKTTDLPPDPTLGFLGENPWQLPAGIVAVLFGAWIVIEQLGLSSIVLHRLK